MYEYYSRNETTGFDYKSEIEYTIATPAPDNNFVDIMLELKVPERQEIIYVPQQG